MLKRGEYHENHGAQELKTLAANPLRCQVVLQALLFRVSSLTASLQTQYFASTQRKEAIATAKRKTQPRLGSFAHSPGRRTSGRLFASTNDDQDDTSFGWFVKLGRRRTA